MATGVYKVWVDKILRLEWHQGSVDSAVARDVSWDSKKTEVEKAELRITARASGMSQVFIYMKVLEVSGLHLKWESYEDMETKTATSDVTGSLINGSNHFEVRYTKYGVWPFNTTIVFTLELIVTYSGEEPEVKPWWERYAVPMAIGLSSTLVGGIAVSEYAKKRGE